MKYQIVWLLGTGIGNVIEALYSVEYCLRRNVSCAISIDDIPASFIAYVEQCYPDLLVNNEEGVSCEHLIHSWLYHKEVKIRYSNHIYVNPDEQSVEYSTEDEAYLNIVKSIYPSSEDTTEYLTKLIEHKPKIFKSDKYIEDLYVLYIGSSAFSPVKRWPYYTQLIELLQKEKVILVGGKDDVDFRYSFRYPKIFGKVFSKKVTNNIHFWKILKAMKLLIPHAHINLKGFKERVFINKFTWPELVYIFRRAKGYVGNDGGLSHLASAANVKRGITIFGPSSIKKNRPFNTNIRSLSTNLTCQPCYFNANGIHMGKNYINCPYGIKCLEQITPEDIKKELLNIS